MERFCRGGTSARYGEPGPLCQHSVFAVGTASACRASHLRHGGHKRQSCRASHECAETRACQGERVAAAMRRNKLATGPRHPEPRRISGRILSTTKSKTPVLYGPRLTSRQVAYGSVCRSIRRSIVVGVAGFCVRYRFRSRLKFNCSVRVPALLIAIP